MIYFINSHQPLLAFWSGSFAVAFVCWLVAVRLPTRCGVTTLKGHPCPNPTTGVLFGCGKHTWDKLFARFGIRRRTEGIRVSPTISRNPAVEPAASEPSAKVSGVKEDPKDAIVFWLTAVSTAAGVVSMVTSIVAIS